MHTHAVEKWLPKTLDCLKDDNDHILDLCDSLQASLNLYVNLVSMHKNEENHPVFNQSFKDSARMKYLEPMVHTIEAGMSTLAEEETAVEKLGMIQYQGGKPINTMEIVNTKRRALGMVQC